MKRILAFWLSLCLLFVFCACGSDGAFDAGQGALRGDNVSGTPDSTPDGEQKPDGEQAPDGERNPDGEQTPDGEQNPDEEQTPDGEQNPDEEQTPNEGQGDSTQGEGTQTPTVYYTPKGEVYHLKRDCSYIKNSKEVLSGTLEAAQTAGKLRACSRCGKTA